MVNHGSVRYVNRTLQPPRTDRCRMSHTLSVYAVDGNARHGKAHCQDNHRWSLSPHLSTSIQALSCHCNTIESIFFLAPPSYLNEAPLRVICIGATHLRASSPVTPLQSGIDEGFKQSQGIRCRNGASRVHHCQSAGFYSLHVLVLSHGKALSPQVGCLHVF